jgi:hypothetical protein
MEHFIVVDDVLFEAKVLHHTGEEAREVMYSGPRETALWVCLALNSRLDSFEFPTGKPQTGFKGF